MQKARELLKEEYLPKIERCVEKLTDEQVWWRPNSESNSIGNLLLHLSGNARQWIVCGLGGATDERQRQTEFDERRIIPRDELLSRLRTTIAEVDGVLRSFDPERLLKSYPIQGTEASPRGHLSRDRTFLDAHWPDNSAHEDAGQYRSGLLRFLNRQTGTHLAGVETGIMLSAFILVLVQFGN